MYVMKTIFHLTYLYRHAKDENWTVVTSVQVCCHQNRMTLELSEMHMYIQTHWLLC